METDIGLKCNVRWKNRNMCKAQKQCRGRNNYLKKERKKGSGKAEKEENLIWNLKT